MNTEDASISEHYRRMTGEPVNSVGAHGPLSATNEEKRSPPGGIALVPVLCLNMWEHVWLPDYGFFERGKQAFAENWLNRIDWKVVAENAEALPTGNKFW